MKTALKKPGVRMSWDRKLLSISPIGKIVERINTSSFWHEHSLSVHRGFQSLKGWRLRLMLCRITMWNSKWPQASDSVREGASLRKALDQTKPSHLWCCMIASGEQRVSWNRCWQERQTTKTKALSRRLHRSRYLYPSPYRVDGRLSAVYRDGD